MSSLSWNFQAFVYVWYIKALNICVVECKTFIPFGDTQNLNTYIQENRVPKSNNTLRKWLYKKVERALTYYLYFSLVDSGLSKNYEIKLTRKYEKDAERLYKMSRKHAKGLWSPSLKMFINLFFFFFLRYHEDKLEFIRGNN